MLVTLSGSRMRTRPGGWAKRWAICVTGSTRWCLQFSWYHKYQLFTKLWAVTQYQDLIFPLHVLAHSPLLRSPKGDRGIACAFVCMCPCSKRHPLPIKRKSVSNVRRGRFAKQNEPISISPFFTTSNTHIFVMIRLETNEICFTFHVLLFSCASRILGRRKRLQTYWYPLKGLRHKQKSHPCPDPHRTGSERSLVLQKIRACSSTHVLHWPVASWEEWSRLWLNTFVLTNCLSNKLANWVTDWFDRFHLY